MERVRLFEMDWLQVVVPLADELRPSVERYPAVARREAVVEPLLVGNSAVE